MGCGKGAVREGRGTSSEAPALALVSTDLVGMGKRETLAQVRVGPLWHRQRRSVEGEGASMEEILLRTCGGWGGSPA